MNIKYLTVTFFVLFAGQIFALPNCPPSGLYDMCYGSFSFVTGNKYTGEFKMDQRHGLGTFEYADGDKYIGDFKNDNRDGQGTYLFSNGDIYAGLWKNDVREGKGSFTYASGKVESGVFINGNFITNK